MAATHRNEISEAVERIGLFEANETFEPACIIPPPKGATRLEVISLTSIHMQAGSPKPRLHKLTTLPTVFPREVRDTSTAAIAACVNPLRQETFGLPNGPVRQMSDYVLNTCEAIDKQEESKDTPFRILGVLGVYQADKSAPFGYIFTDREFTEDLATRLPRVPAFSEISEETKRQVHTLQAENSTDVLPYNEWLKELPEATMVQNSDNPQTRALALARGVVHLLVLPREATHPVFNVKLF